MMEIVGEEEIESKGLDGYNKEFMICIVWSSWTMAFLQRPISSNIDLTTSFLDCKSYYNKWLGVTGYLWANNATLIASMAFFNLTQSLIWLNWVKLIINLIAGKTIKDLFGYFYRIKLKIFQELDLLIHLACIFQKPVQTPARS